MRKLGGDSAELQVALGWTWTLKHFDPGIPLYDAGADVVINGHDHE